MNGVDKKIYLEGLIHHFGLTPQPVREMSRKPDENGWLKMEDKIVYRLFSHPGDRYGHNWNWLEADFLQPHGCQLPSENEVA